MKKSILIFTMISLANFSYGQSIIKLDNKKLPYPTIDNIIKWTESSLGAWKKEMSYFDFMDNSVSSTGANYFKTTVFNSNSLSNTYLFEKYMGKKIQISYTCYDEKQIFDDFLDEISDYYVQNHGSGMIEYGIKHNSYLYRIVIMRTATLEIIDVERF